MKVNGEEIPQKAVEYELNRLIHFYVTHGIPQDQIKASLESLKARAEEQVIGTFLLFGEANRQDIPVTEEEIDESIRAMEQQAGGAEKLREILASYENVLPFNDKVSPEIIRRETGMSKNEFKRAVGHLLKLGEIEIGEKVIRKIK